MARPTRSTPRCRRLLRCLPTWIIAVQVCASSAAGAREAPFSIEENSLATETTALAAALSTFSSLSASSSSAPVLPAGADTAADALFLQLAADEGAGSEAEAAWTPVPGLPDLPETGAPLESVQADARAAVASLRAAVTYNGTKKIPYSSKGGPIWRRGVPPPVAQFQANTVPSQQPPVVPIPVPAGVVVEEYEVLSEERVVFVNGTKVVERIWVPVTVGRPAGSSAAKKRVLWGPTAAASASRSSYPALLILHSTSGNRARSLQRVIKAAQRGYVALAPDARYFGTRGVLWESNCTVWQEKMAYLNNKAANANTVSGNGASCPAPANATLGDLPLYEDQIVASYVNRGASERPFLLDNVWDLQRVLDWLFYVGTDEKVEVEWSGQQQKQQGPAVAAADAAFSLSDKVLRRDVFGENRRLFNVDAARVGTTGISLGGLHSSLLGVVEQRRIAVLAPAIGVPTFAWGAGHGDEWKPRAYSIPNVFLYAAKEAGLAAPTNEIYVKVLNLITPNLLGPYDASRSLAALAPRPLLIANGALDGRNPLGGVEMAVARAQKVYDSQGKSGNLEYFLDPNAVHEYTPAMEAQVDAWLDRWLLR